MPGKRHYWLIAMALLIVAVFFFVRRGGKDPYEMRGMNRDPADLVYTKHARCRMDCRQISESEVAAILVEGKENYAKTDLSAKPNPRYALEGRTGDGQRVRIIFAPDHGKVVVVTAIDLDKDWPCQCE